MTMLSLFRKVTNVFLLNSPYYFEDGSRVSYLAQLDILRYQVGRGSQRKIVDIGLEYNSDTGLMFIDTIGPWRWRSMDVPLNQPSESGPQLTESERTDVISKLREFTGKHPKKYERF